jgi:toxin ParE1/3/4
LAEWTASALSDLDATLERIGQDSPEAAQTVGKRILAAVARLDQFPELGRAGRRQGTRELAIPRLPYLIVYQLRQEQVVLLRVLHSSLLWPA